MNCLGLWRHWREVEVAGTEKGFPGLNRLTTIRLGHYSSGMISDFELLAQKVGELADLAQLLRRENAGLRAQVALVGIDNSDLRQRMQLAHERVAALLARLPEPMPPPEAEILTQQQDQQEHA